MYWDCTGEWRMTYYEKLHQKNEKDLSFVEKSERDLDSLENKIISNLLNDNNKIKEVLDIGCGVGRQIIHFASVYPTKNFTGIDISTHQICLLQKYINDNNITNIIAKQMNATEISGLKMQYNLVTFFNNSFGCLKQEEQEICLNLLPKIVSDNGYLLFGSFDKIDMAETCYKEWMLPPIDINYNSGEIDLGEYKSYWKTEKMFVPSLVSNSFVLCTKESAGLGSVYVFKKSK